MKMHKEIICIEFQCLKLFQKSRYRKSQIHELIHNHRGTMECTPLNILSQLCLASK